MFIHPLYSLNGESFVADSMLLTGLFRDYPGALPWNGTASASNSSSHNITTGTNPDPGPVINGRKTASFNGSTQFANTADNISAYWTNVNNFSGWVLFNATSVSTNNTTSKYLNSSLLAYTGSSYFYLYLRSAGNIGFGIFNNTANVEVETTFTIGKWQLAQFSLSGGTTMSICCGGTTFATQSTAAGIGSTAATFNVGKNVDGTLFYNGLIAEIGLYPNVLSASNFSDIRYKYIPRRYGLVV